MTSSRRRRGLVLLAAAAMLIAATLIAARVIDRWMIGVAQAIPTLSRVPIFHRLWDHRPVTARITVAWQRIPHTATAETFMTDHTLWNRMFHDDWDFVPDPLRSAALDRLWQRYARLVAAPPLWDDMDAFAWDEVPQPVRAVAFIEMVRYWSGFYQVGARYGLQRGTVTNTMAAIMMTESLFEHRAINRNAAGNRDLGLAQTSDYARATLDRLRRAGRIDFAPATEAAYDDPWQATRVLAIWFDLMLDETRGDLDLAIRAYHRGTPLALAGEGAEYLEVVVGRRRRYFRDPSGSPTWEFLRERAAAHADGIRTAAAARRKP